MPIKHALVVDDSKSARFSLKKLLQQQDIKTDFAESAGDALNYLSSHSPDIIFMDHLMPGMDGFEATKAIKGNPDIQNIPIIMCTSKEGSDYAEQALAVGAYAILPKPAPAATLTAILNKLGSETMAESQAQIAEPRTGTSTPNLSIRVVENIVRKTLDERIEQFQKQVRESIVDPILADTREKMESLKTDLKAEFQSRLENQVREQGTSISHRVASELIDARIETISLELNEQVSDAMQQLDNLLRSAKEPSPGLLEEVKKVAQFTAAATAGEAAKEAATSISQTIAQDTTQGELDNIKNSIMDSVNETLANAGIKHRDTLSIIAIIASMAALLITWFGG